MFSIFTSSLILPLGMAIAVPGNLWTSGGTDAYSYMQGHVILGCLPKIPPLPEELENVGESPHCTKA